MRSKQSISRVIFYVSIGFGLIVSLATLIINYFYSDLGLPDSTLRPVSLTLLIFAVLSVGLFAFSAYTCKGKKRWVSLLLVLAAAGLSLYNYVVFWLSGYGS